MTFSLQFSICITAIFCNIIHAVIHINNVRQAKEGYFTRLKSIKEQIDEELKNE